MKYFLLKTIWKSFSYIPLPFMYFLADLFFYPFYYLVRYRRKIVRKNLTESFPDKNIDEIIKIEKKFYRYFLDIFLETNKIATISNKRMMCRMKFINIESVNNSISVGKHVSLYLGHFGNWEWISSIYLHLSNDVAGGQIYKKINNKLFNRLMLENRSRFGVENIEKKETLRWLFEKNQNKKIITVGYIADQSPKKSESNYFILFLNHNVPVFTGTEKITKKFGTDAYYIDIKRVKRGYYEADLIKMHENPKSLPDFELTDVYFKYLEESIRKQPELYLWSHNRFKNARK